MSSPIAIPRSNKATASSSSSSSSYSSVASSSSSPATSYSPNMQTKYVPIHKRSPSPSPIGSYLSLSQFLSNVLTYRPTDESHISSPRTYSIHELLALRGEAHTRGFTDMIKAKLRAGPTPELVMNRKMRKNLEFAEHHHRRVSPTSSVNVSPVAKTASLPPVVTVAPVPTQVPAPTKNERFDSPHARYTRTKFSSRTPHPQQNPHPQTSESKKHPFGGLHSNLASWRTPVPPRLAVN